MEEQQQEKHDREVELREQDRWLPIANVARLMKNTLPSTAKVSKDAKECMQECVSEFISFITSESSDKCLSEKRKTINGEDILFAMSSLGFENYAEVLKIYLAKYREQQALKQERGETKRVKKSHPSSESIYEEQQQLEQEVTNIPLHEEDQELSLESQLPNDVIGVMKVDEEDMLNLEDAGEEEQEALVEQKPAHRFESAMKSEEDGVLYEYNEQY